MSRCRILKEGDRNTRYFHLVATMRRKRKLIEKLTVDGQTITEPSELKKAVISYFKNLYTKQESSTFDIGSLGLAKLTTEQQQRLEAPVTLQEIKEAI